MKRNGAVYISNLLEPRQLRYDLRSSEHNLIQPSYTNPSHTYKASHLCNQLPSYAKLSTELSEFFKNLRSLKGNLQI